jgi:ABC-type multidrug transport system fused ATPase/permease subunit
VNQNERDKSASGASGHQSRTGSDIGSAVSASGVAFEAMPGIEKSNSPMADVATWEDWREYLDLVSWLIPDVFRHGRGRVVSVVLLSTIGVAARAATIGSMLLYINARATGTPLILGGVTLPTHASAAVFALWGALALGFAALTIAASYRADVIIFRIAQSYMEMAVQRVLRHHAAGREIDLPEDLETRSSKPIALMLRGDTYRLVRVVVQTLGILMPLITLAASAAVLIATNWMLTAFLLPALAIYSYGVGLVNRAVLRDSQKRQFARQHLTRDVNAILRTLDGTRYPSNGAPEWLASYPERSWLQEAMSAFRGIILSKKRVAYLSDGFQGIALLLIVMVFGTMIAGETTSWAVLLTYLMGLGYATRSMGRASKCVTAANRFIPQVRHYVLFMQTHPPAVAPPRDRSSDGVFHFEAREPRLPGSLDMLEARPGQVMWCISRGRTSNGSLGELLFALSDGDPNEARRIESETFFLRGVPPLPARPLSCYLPVSTGEDGADTTERMHRFFADLGVAEEFGAQLGSPDAQLTAELDEQLSPILRYGLRLLPGVLTDSRLIVLDHEPLEKLGEGRDRLLATLADRLVMLVPRSARTSPIQGMAAVMVCQAGSILGIGDAEWHATLDWSGAPGDSEKSEIEWSDSDDDDDLDDMEEED